MSAITPTIGRKVWFRPLNSGHSPSGPLHNLNPELPMDATIVFVHAHGPVNLHVIDHAGASHPMLNVPLLQPGEPVPDLPHCEWMPYQVRQAQAEQPQGVTQPMPAFGGDNPTTGGSAGGAGEPIAVTASGAIIEGSGGAGETLAATRTLPVASDIPSAGDDSTISQDASASSSSSDAGASE